MPFQPINFASIEPMGLSGLRNMASNLKHGYELGRMPAKAKQEDEQNRLANAFKQMQMDAIPQQQQQKAHEQERLDKLAESLIDYRKMNSGKTIPPTLEEKNKAALDLHKQKKDIDISENVSDAATDVRKTIRIANQLQQIIKNNPDATGFLSSKKHQAGFGSTDTGEVAEKALVLQAQLMKTMSKLGGVGIAKIVGKGKVDIGNSPKSNLGVIKSIINDSISSYKELRSKNKKHGGKTLDNIDNLFAKSKPEVFKQTFKSKDDAIAYGKSLSPEKRVIFLKQLQGGGQ